jgi:hypothetical protein
MSEEKNVKENNVNAVDWNKVNDELIYKFKALNVGTFNKGKFYDFYQRKEAEVADDYVAHEYTDIIDKTTIMPIEHEITDLWRVTIFFK